jgi:hypothetical protein
VPLGGSAQRAGNDGVGLGAVAAPAADDEAAIGAASLGDFADVVGGEVRGGVGGAAGPSGAPVPDDEAVVGDGLGAAASFGAAVVEVGATGDLGALVHRLAAGAAVAPAAELAAAEA